LDIRTLIQRRLGDRGLIDDHDFGIANPFGDEGRILVRASGTEPKIRVMVEALQADKVEHWCGHIAGIIKDHLTA
jgi:phosphomannomutase